MSFGRTCVLTQKNSQLILVDHRTATAADKVTTELRSAADNRVALAKTAKKLNVPTTITTQITEDPLARIHSNLGEICPNQVLLERTAINAWDDVRVQNALAENGRRHLIVAELWAEDSDYNFALSALRDANYITYLVTDASSGLSEQTKHLAFKRLTAAGVITITFRQVIRKWIGRIDPRRDYQAVTYLERAFVGERRRA